MTKATLLTFYAIVMLLVQVAAFADEALVVPIRIQAEEKSELLYVATSELPQFLVELGYRDTSHLGKFEAEGLARQLNPLVIYVVQEYPRSGILILTTKERRMSLREVHETASLYMARLLVFGARELPNQKITLETLNEVLKQGGEGMRRRR